MSRDGAINLRLQKGYTYWNLTLNKHISSGIPNHFYMLYVYVNVKNSCESQIFLILALRNLSLVFPEETT